MTTETRRVYLREDEYFPWFYEDDDDDPMVAARRVEMSEEFYHRWRMLREQWGDIQKELRRLYYATHGRPS